MWLQRKSRGAAAERGRPLDRQRATTASASRASASRAASRRRWRCAAASAPDACADRAAHCPAAEAASSSARRSEQARDFKAVASAFLWLWRTCSLCRADEFFSSKRLVALSGYGDPAVEGEILASIPSIVSAALCAPTSTFNSCSSDLFRNTGIRMLSLVLFGGHETTCSRFERAVAAESTLFAHLSVI